MSMPGSYGQALSAVTKRAPEGSVRSEEAVRLVGLMVDDDVPLSAYHLAGAVGACATDAPRALRLVEEHVLVANAVVFNAALFSAALARNPAVATQLLSMMSERGLSPGAADYNNTLIAHFGVRLHPPSRPSVGPSELTVPGVVRRPATPSGRFAC